jgi:spore maturation protein CgeB
MNDDDVLFFPAGYSPNTTYDQFSPEYECDVSFVGTNLYTGSNFPNQTINRKQVLDLIYADPSIKLHVYGTEKFRYVYPNSYRGFIPYSQCYRVFSSSKINLNISPVLDTPVSFKNSGFVYYSERLPQILGSNGVLLCNNDLSPLLLPGIHYIYIKSLDELIPTLKHYLNHPELLETIKINSAKFLNKFNYEHIVKNISNLIIDSYKL